MSLKEMLLDLERNDRKISNRLNKNRIHLLSDIVVDTDSGSQSDYNDSDFDQIPLPPGLNHLSLRITDKFFCCFCGKFLASSDFSKIQLDLPNNQERYCLRHTSTSSFNRSYRKPETLKPLPISDSDSEQEVSDSSIEDDNKVVSDLKKRTVVISSDDEEESSKGKRKKDSLSNSFIPLIKTEKGLSSSPVLTRRQKRKLAVNNQINRSWQLESSSTDSEKTSEEDIGLSKKKRRIVPEDSDSASEEIGNGGLFCSDQVYLTVIIVVSFSMKSTLILMCDVQDLPQTSSIGNCLTNEQSQSNRFIDLETFDRRFQTFVHNYSSNPKIITQNLPYFRHSTKNTKLVLAEQWNISSPLPDDTHEWSIRSNSDWSLIDIFWYEYFRVP
ncbi:hypothetical protein BC833DRAFT_568540 [Globomyces pollinis-pini]|nr:hypothetical protein BC833DRAFT_568540 [Globomyces pollinis-pini]